MDEFKDVILRLEKPLRLETKQGFLDRAVSGGMEAYVKRWAPKAGANLAKAMVPLFDHYSNLSPQDRKRPVLKALELLGQRAEDGGRKAEDGGQKAEDGGQKAE